MSGETMTGNAFLKRLRFQLDFLSIEDQEVVLSYYENKLQSADTLTQEEEITRSFGAPEFIADKLRKLYFKHLDEIQSENNTAGDDDNASVNNSSIENKNEAELCEETAVIDDNKVDLDSNEEPISENIVESNNEEIKESTNQEFCDPITTSVKNSGDFIFSRAESQEHYSEVVHTIEYDEVTPIYGEKVNIADDNEKADEIDPTDQENGFTPEEIEEAKKETLQKAKNYTTESFSPIQQGDNIPLEVEHCEADEISPEESSAVSENSFDTKQESEKSKDEKDYVGLFNIPFVNKESSQALIVFTKLLFTILCSPLLIPAFGAMIVLYALLLVVLLSVTILLSIVDLAFIIGGVIELAYGFTLLFECISVALIELGLGTALFGLVVAFSALIYEFLSATLPKLFKASSRFFKSKMKKFICLFYGGRA